MKSLLLVESKVVCSRLVVGSRLMESSMILGVKMLMSLAAVLALSILDRLAFKGGQVELWSEEGELVVVLFMFGTRLQGEQVMVAGAR